MADRVLTCVPPPALTPEQRMKAFELAAKLNPANVPAGVHEPQRAALLASAYWGAKGVDLTVSFMESIQADLRDRILSHFNAWQTVAGANVKFRWVQSGGQVRVSRGPGGYWSYLGSDVLAIPKGEQTMNLESFTMQTPESEFVRVIRHEVGHCIGFPHEHLRPALVALLDRAKTIAYFERTQGWSEQDVVYQVLTPLTESSLLGATPADASSIMCYDIPGECTRSGEPIAGGTDIDQFDKDCVDKLYPLSDVPPEPQPRVVYSFALKRAVRIGGTLPPVPARLEKGKYSVVEND